MYNESVLGATFGSRRDDNNNRGATIKEKTL